MDDRFTGIIAPDAESHRSAYDALTTRTQQLALAHEIGHVLGLEALHNVPCG